MYQKSAAEHFAEAITRISNKPNPLSPGGAIPQPPPRGQATAAEPPAGLSFSIAISREAGSGGITVAREIGRRLNWPVYDQELLGKLAEELKVDVSLVEEIDERPGSWLVETLKAFAAVANVTEVTYFRRLVRMLRALGARGECIIVGRGSTYVLNPETTLRVRVVASRDDRIAFMSKERGMTPAAAANYVDTKDRERVKFIKDHFHKDLADPLNYDLVLNRTRFTLDETAELVIEALQRMQARKGAVKVQK
jgi:cytidylate kinase